LEKRKVLGLEDAAALLHTILFAYQKSNRDILGSGAAVFVDPILDTMNKLYDKLGITLTEGNVDKAMKDYATLLMTSRLVGKAAIEKLPREGYTLRIEGCAFNPNGAVHELLKPKDVTCPWAMIAMATYSKCADKKIAITDSTFEKDLAITEIKPRA
jgi:hypothetical protein